MSTKRKLSETGSVELYESIHNLLVAKGFEKSASAFLKEANVDKKKSSTSQDLAEIFSNFQTTKKVKAEVIKSSSSSSSDSSSSSEDEAPKKTPVVAKAVAAKKPSSSSDSSSDSSSEDEAPKKAPVSAVKSVAKKAVSSSSSSSSDSSSEDEAPKKSPSVASSKVTPAKKAASSSSSSSSDSSSSEDEAPPKKVAKKAEAAVVSTPKPALKPAATPSADAADGKEHKIYVKGLPWLATEAEVKDFFKDCGTIVSTECPMGEDGRSSGTAYVKFSKRSELDAALAMDGQTWPGTERWLKIQEGFDKPDRRSFGGESGPKPEGCDTVFVGNLPWDVEEENMREIFGAAGEISSVRFAMGEDGAFRGFGHVSFFDGNCVDEAIKLAGTQLNGRAIRVDYAPPRNREAGGGRGGGRGDGGRGRGGGRGDGGRGRGGGRGTPTAGPASKAKGSIAVSAGKKMTFDE